MVNKSLVKDIANKSNMTYLKSYYSYYRFFKSYLEKLLNILLCLSLKKQNYFITSISSRITGKLL